MKLTKNAGFTLIEVMIVMAIVGIIAGLASSNYFKYIEKSNRSDAKNVLTSAAALQEKWYLQYSQYTNNVDDLTGSASTKGYYAIAVVNNAMSGTACDEGNCYTITATAQAGQLTDTDCARLTIDNVGRRKAYDSDSNEVDNCW